MVASQVEVGGDKAGAVHDPGIHAFLHEPPAPKRLGDVHLNSGAVPFVPDLPGPMLHLLKGFESLMDESMGGPTVLGHDGNDGTAVPFLLGKGSRKAGDVLVRRTARLYRGEVDGSLFRGHRWLPSEIGEGGFMP